MELPISIAQLLIWLTLALVALLMVFVVGMLLVRLFKFKDIKDYLPIKNIPSKISFYDVLEMRKGKRMPVVKPTAIIRMNNMQPFQLVASLNTRHSKDMYWHEASTIVGTLLEEGIAEWSAMYYVAISSKNDTLLYIYNNLKEEDYTPFLVNASKKFKNMSLYMSSGEGLDEFAFCSYYQKGKQITEDLNMPLLERRLAECVPSVIDEKAAAAVFRLFDEVKL